eukprot:TRINITY_DN17017_c0_g2_i1.p1 TRINITY_DN17017_c0_g2~~TRINITY_DN17017_c0_g2_i1.p1  ORF type:complete len:874 (+),score=185.29 TRINITY_DN17017_c0_g2_i1:65-2623(+)
MDMDELSTPIKEYVLSRGGKVSTASGSPAAAAKTTDSAFEKRVQSLLSVGEECINESEMRNLLERKPNFVLYDGFEPSGRMHIAQGIFKAINVNKCTAAGGTFKFWVADLFALMNDKMGGNLDMIKDVGKYLIEVWKSSGMKMDHVQFIWCEHFLGELADKYWTQMLDISRCSNLTRIKKCGMIMGRNSDGDLSSAQILYPIMQCTDIFALEADICQLGVDQRKVNMLARDYCDAAGRKLKPIILSHHMLYGLSQGQAKMSKSDPDSAVFMEDSAEDVERKIMKAYCPKIAGERDVVIKEDCQVTCDTSQMPPVVSACSSAEAGIKIGDLLLAVDDKPIGECVGNISQLLAKKPVTLTMKTPSAEKKPVANDDDTMRLVKDDLENPILDYIKNIVLGADDSEPVNIDGKTYKSEQEIREAFCAGGFEKSGRISKPQLKTVVIERVNAMLMQARKHFTENPEAKRLLELVESHKKAVKEGKVVVPKSVRCLKKVDCFSKKPGCAAAVVFAPRPPTIPALSMDVVLSCLVAINKAASQADKVVLWCEDWGAFCLNCCSNAKPEDARKLLATWYGLLADSLKLLAPELMNKKVEVVLQSNQILKDPNAYWVCAINVGRAFKLDKIRQSLADGEVLTESSQVVTTLMHVADMIALCAAEGVKSLRVVPVLPCAASEAGSCVSVNAHKSAAGYISDVVAPEAKSCKEAMVVPTVEDAAVTFKDVSLDVLVGDGEPAINSKIKKLYCLAGDIENCPCVDLLEKLDATGQLRRATQVQELLVIKGSEKSGHPEDRTFKDAKAVKDEFAKGEAAIHPGDLKASVSPAVRTVLGPILQCKDPDFTKAHKQLSDAAKKLKKK